eukprot:COSAG02_NODE_55402_length_290_cov_2.445026_1_plen_21_part_01
MDAARATQPVLESGVRGLFQT